MFFNDQSILTDKSSTTVAMIPKERSFMDFSMQQGLGTLIGVAKFAAVPYLAIMALLFTFQRTILYPKPSEIAGDVPLLYNPLS